MTENQTKTQAFAAAHPIFDRKLKVHAYDLEFRSGFASLCEEMIRNDSPDMCEVIDLEGMVGLAKAHVVFPSRLVTMDLPVLFPPDTLIVGLEDAKADDWGLVRSCRQLSEFGYEVAASHPGAGSPGSPFLESLSVVRIDAATPPAEQAKLCEELWLRGIHTLADNVDGAESFDDASKRGYRYFQGDFFRQPAVKPGKEIPANKVRYLQLLEEVNKPELPLDELDALIKQDVTMTFRLLRFINSAWFGLRTAITSIRHALVLLGPREVRKWASMLVVGALGDDKPDELFRRCLIRARMAEQVAPRVGMKRRAPELFLMGMFSLVDALTDIPLARVLKGLPLSKDITLALLAQSGQFAPVYKLVASYEQGQWSAFSQAAEASGLDESDAPALFIAAREWADGALLSMSNG
ncbi:MAG: HDOD domain-containing protein [Phycisphaerae bacterium]